MRLASKMMLALLCVGVGAGSAWAQAEPPPASQPAAGTPTTQPAAGPAPTSTRDRKRPGLNVEEPETAAPEPGAQIGVGVRSRFIFLPSAVLNLFLDHSTSMSQYAIGGEVIRRKGNLDLVFGLEYANISPKDGFYLEKGKNPAMEGDYPDYIHFDNFAMISLDGSFIWHTDLTDFMQFRYGAGIGVGFLLGNIVKNKQRCVSTTTPDQLDDPGFTGCTATGVVVNADKPPVVPIVNLLLGLRFKIVEQLSANVEVGFRDVFFAGISVGYFF